jgi:hypothetical protein
MRGVTAQQHGELIFSIRAPNFRAEKWADFFPNLDKKLFIPFYFPDSPERTIFQGEKYQQL